ncbi:hypothetical protein PENSPDRAFT_659272 [Peniophora sp. CONT]|nr:hypothetical protein PENSPDRAFT_659272 [Peniophora sp. CONT]
MDAKTILEVTDGKIVQCRFVSEEEKISDIVSWARQEFLLGDGPFELEYERKGVKACYRLRSDADLASFVIYSKGVAPHIVCARIARVSQAVPLRRTVSAQPRLSQPVSPPLRRIDLPELSLHHERRTSDLSTTALGRLSKEKRKHSRSPSSDRIRPTRAAKKARSTNGASDESGSTEAPLSGPQIADVRFKNGLKRIASDASSKTDASAVSASVRAPAKKKNKGLGASTEVAVAICETEPSAESFANRARETEDEWDEDEKEVIQMLCGDEDVESAEFCTALGSAAGDLTTDRLELAAVYAPDATQSTSPADDHALHSEIAASELAQAQSFEMKGLFFGDEHIGPELSPRFAVTSTQLVFYCVYDAGITHHQLVVPLHSIRRVLIEESARSACIKTDTKPYVESAPGAADEVWTAPGKGFTVNMDVPNGALHAFGDALLGSAIRVEWHTGSEPVVPMPRDPAPSLEPAHGTNDRLASLRPRIRPNAVKPKLHLKSRPLKCATVKPVSSKQAAEPSSVCESEETLVRAVELGLRVRGKRGMKRGT